jgi:hypothetical protein
MPGASFDVPDPMMVAREIIVVDDEAETTLQAKDLVTYLGMRDGLTASMASQVDKLVAVMLETAIHNERITL